MKIVARTLVILSAALIIAGVTFAIAQASGAQQSSSLRDERRPAAQQLPAAGAPNAAPGAFGRDNRGGAGLFAAAELLKNLVIVAVIVAFVAPAARLMQGRRAATGRRRIGERGTSG